MASDLSAVGDAFVSRLRAASSALPAAGALAGALSAERDNAVGRVRDALREMLFVVLLASLHREGGELAAARPGGAAPAAPPAAGGGEAAAAEAGEEPQEQQERRRQDEEEPRGGALPAHASPAGADGASEGADAAAAEPPAVEDAPAP
jgi:hypothetical protein